MKTIKFILNAKDKYTNEEYKKDDEKQFEDKRADEILKARTAKGEAFAILLIEDQKQSATKVSNKRKVKKEDV